MPLGTLYGLNPGLLIRPEGVQACDAFIDKYDEMVIAVPQDVTRLDTNRGHIHLSAILMEDGRLPNALMGNDLICEAEWGVMTLLEPKDVSAFAKIIQQIEPAALNVLFQSYQTQFADKEPERPSGFFARMFGRDNQGNEVEVDPSLMDLFIKVQAFFIGETKKGNIVVVRMVL